MKKITSLAILLFLSACSFHQALEQTHYQEEAKEGAYHYNHRPSIRMEEEREEYFEQHRTQK